MTGSVQLPKDTEMVMPGDNVHLEVELISVIAMEKGVHFAVREGGKNSGSGSYFRDCGVISFGRKGFLRLRRSRAEALSEFVNKSLSRIHS